MQTPAADRRRGGADDVPARAGLGAAPATTSAAAIVGATRPEQVHENARAAEVRLSDDTLARDRRGARRGRRPLEQRRCREQRLDPPAAVRRGGRVPQLVEALLGRRALQPAPDVAQAAGMDAAPVGAPALRASASRGVDLDEVADDRGNPAARAGARSARGPPASGSCCRPRRAAGSPGTAARAPPRGARVRSRSRHTRTCVSRKRSRYRLVLPLPCTPQRTTASMAPTVAPRALTTRPTAGAGARARSLRCA